jgi:sugar phosphate isomerase/epimerase
MIGSRFIDVSSFYRRSSFWRAETIVPCEIVTNRKVFTVPELKIGIQLASLGLPLKQALVAAAQLGARAVELDARGEFHPRQFTGTALRQLRKMLEELRLRVCAVSFHTRRGYDVPDDLDRRIDATKSAMQFAYSVGAPVVVNQIGRVPSQGSGPGWDRLVEAVGDLARYGQHVGASLAAETGSESGEDLARLINALPGGSLVGVTLDPGNLIVNGFSCLAAVAKLGPHIMHVHARDGVRDLARGRGLEVPLGRGSADFPALLGALEEHAYHGYFTIERERADDPVAEIEMAVKYLRSL